MQRVVAARGEVAVDGDEILHAGYLARKDDAVARRGRAPRRARRESSADWTIASRMTARRPAAARARAFSSISRVSSSWSSEPQLTPMRTGFAYLSADSMIVANCDRASCLKPTLPGLMRYLASASAHAGCSRQQLVAVVVEVADQRHVAPVRVEPVADVRHGRRRLARVDRDAHELGAGARERAHLRDGRRRCRRCRCWSSTARRRVRRRRRPRRRRRRGEIAACREAMIGAKPAWLPFPPLAPSVYLIQRRILARGRRATPSTC